MTQTSPLSPGTHVVVLDGFVQGYHVHGTGPVCLAYPGGPGIFCDYLRSPELERHLTMVYVEPPGTGVTERLPAHPHGYTRDRYIERLDRLIEHLQVPRVHLVGHSFGGFVSQYYAVRRPGRLAGVILYGSAPALDEEHAAETRRNLEEYARRHAGHPETRSILDAFADETYSTDEEAAANLKAIFPLYFADYRARQAEFEPMRAAIRATYLSPLDEDGNPMACDDRADLPAVAVPTLVVAGRHDFICGVRWAKELAELIPGSELHVFEGSGHFPHWEEPDEFARIVLDFVKRT